MNILDTFVNRTLPAEIPHVRNIEFKNQTIKWSGSDQWEHFSKNLRDARSNNLLKNLGWDTADFDYSYNSHGFRDQEFDSRECGLAIGCSFTEGIGLPTDVAWPRLLSKLCGIHVWNLGSGGASIETTFRILEYYILKLKPKFVCVLIPPPMRFEYNNFVNGFPIIQANDLGMHPTFGKDWLSQEYNGKTNRKKTMLAIDNICRHFSIPLAANDSQIGIGAFNLNNSIQDLARDLMHPGIKYQQYHAEYMFTELNKLNILTSK
jgi:hypothetical protein